MTPGANIVTVSVRKNLRRAFRPSVDTPSCAASNNYIVCRLNIAGIASICERAASRVRTTLSRRTSRTGGSVIHILRLSSPASLALKNKEGCGQYTDPK
jgi:hypothetical protein